MSEPLLELRNLPFSINKHIIIIFYYQYINTFCMAVDSFHHVNKSIYYILINLINTFTDSNIVPQWHSAQDEGGKRRDLQRPLWSLSRHQNCWRAEISFNLALPQSSLAGILKIIWKIGRTDSAPAPRYLSDIRQQSQQSILVLRNRKHFIFSFWIGNLSSHWLTNFGKT